MPSANASALGPIDPTALEAPNEDEKSAPWVVRKLVGSMTGRIVMSSYESLRAAGTSVICLSPWGDSSPLLLPCIRFRDLAVHTVIVATVRFNFLGVLHLREYLRGTVGRVVQRAVLRSFRVLEPQGILAGASFVMGVASKWHAQVHPAFQGTVNVHAY